MTTSGSGSAWGGPPSAEVIAPEQTAEAAALHDDDFERLRELIVGDDRRALDAARARIAELERAQRELGQRLPGALEALRGDRSARVARALAGPVSQALGEAVQKNRQSLVDALFPIIGPLIRKAIAEALRNLVADLNGAVESSFTLRGLKWRIEAWRGGVPYAQVVLKHRLSCRIDHVFLIERESGLVLQHEAAADLAPLDADAIAGMLTALGDFVGDSVGREAGAALESVRVGEHLVWIVPGPRANLACFVRGVPPAELRTLLEQRLEEIHAQFTDGDLRSAGNMALRHELLSPQALLRDTDAATAPSQPGTARWPLLLAILLATAALGWFAASRERWNLRVDSLRAKLAAQPGFVLTGIDSVPWRSVTVHGLLDPDAPSPQPLLAEVGIDARAANLESIGYLSTDDAIVARRAARLLAAPDGVRLAVAHGVLRLQGSASPAWIAAARARAPLIAGVARVETGLQPATDPAAASRVELERVLRELPALRVEFAEGVQPAAGADAALDRIVDAARLAARLAATARVGIELVATGTTDESGGAAANARLRVERARWLADALAARGIAGVRGGTDADSAAATESRRSAHLLAALRSSPQ